MRPERSPIITLFVVEHRHTPDACPASAPTGSLLLDQVSATTAAHFGVSIEAEAFLYHEHLFLLVVEAASRETVERFLAFLGPAGDLKVLLATTAEDAVARGGCGCGTPLSRVNR
ncbi:MAG TPA: sulfite oxidase [Chloroflexota bacterium]